MPKNLLIPKAGSASATRSRCLLQYIRLGLRFVRYQCSSWFGLAIAPFKLLFVSEVERTYVQIRYFRVIAKIDFVSAYGLLNDLLW